jgi:hypothetical protein
MFLLVNISAFSQSQSEKDKKLNAKIEANRNNPNFDMKKFMDAVQQSEMNKQNHSGTKNVLSNASATNNSKKAKTSIPYKAPAVEKVKMTQAEFNSFARIEKTICFAKSE